MTYLMIILIALVMASLGIALFFAETEKKECLMGVVIVEGPFGSWARGDQVLCGRDMEWGGITFPSKAYSGDPT